MNAVCSTQERVLNKTKRSLIDVPEVSKTMEIIDRGLAYNTRLKRKLSAMMESDDSSDASLDVPSDYLLDNVSITAASTSSYESERVFVHNFRNLNGRMHWKKCLDEGHAQGLFTRFTNSNSLRNHFSS
ncbi:hypothetical protein DM01DRAFT_322146 [Hesseltinella vesiculosa]|uniref:Uncharacterized protein n=1 Tax=Hesseltinella vesiculosa TaxID=101127 RepID=A0A1X2GX27_9FUNG|nr:hypothetical protein DM01DRAFT_322146 [Hesseltinella vesiculosa]